LGDVATFDQLTAPLADRRLEPARSSVKRLTMTNFRCYAFQRLEPDGASVVLTGPNGAGKTNILEALSFLAPGRGLRGARLGDVARIPAAHSPEAESTAVSWGVSAVADTPEGPVDVGVGRDMGSGADRRLVRIDGRSARGISALTEVLSIVWLTPQMDRLFLERAGGRRRFLDRLVYGLDPAHAERVAAYEHAMRERARLLREGGADAAWLAALEDAMAANGIAVAAARREITARLNEALAVPRPFPGAMLSVRGDVEAWLDDGPALAAEDRLRDALAVSRRSDSETGGAGIGPHRSDLEVHHRASRRPAALCSTGEQKALLIALVLGGARVQAAARGSLPVLLLDEVAAHLDGRHRDALFGELEAVGGQAWYTGTDRSVFEPLLGRARFYAVDAGVATGC